MKKIILIQLTTLLFIITSCAQENKQIDKNDELSKIDHFVSKKGSIIKFQNYSLGSINLYGGGFAESKVRKISSGEENGFFLQISYKEKYDEKIASIADEDIIELLKANEILKKESIQDANANPEYLENKYITDDGFQLGYYVSKGKTQWYLVLEKYGSGNTILFKRKWRYRKPA